MDATSRTAVRAFKGVLACFVRDGVGSGDEELKDAVAERVDTILTGKRSFEMAN